MQIVADKTRGGRVSNLSPETAQLKCSQLHVSEAKNFFFFFFAEYSTDSINKKNGENVIVYHFLKMSRLAG